MQVNRQKYLSQNSNKNEDDDDDDDDEDEDEDFNQLGGSTSCARAPFGYS